MDQQQRHIKFRKESIEYVEKENIVVGFRIVCYFCLVVGILTLLILDIILMLFWALLGSMESHIPLIVGLALLVVGISLTFAVANHTPLQSQVIAAIVSLGGSAVATEAITGALDVKLTLGEKTLITASGAFAIFIVMYFFRARWDKE